MEVVVAKRATLECQGESLADVAHDARNMVTALGLYCDLIEEPGVLSEKFRHYGSELRLVATASRRMVEKLAQVKTIEAAPGSSNRGADPAAAPSPLAAESHSNLSRRPGQEQAIGHPGESNSPGPVPARSPRWDLMPAPLIQSLAAELTANCNLLSALAGPSIAVTLHVEDGDRPVPLTGEDLTRVLVNLVKNASEAMPGGGRIDIGLREMAIPADSSPWLAITVEDNGPGIPADALEAVFASGYTTRSRVVPLSPGWPASHRGLGLSISRSIVETAGGRIYAARRSSAGARLQVELPVRLP